VIPILNLFRLFALFLLCLSIYLFAKNKAVYYFLKFAGPSFIKLGQILSVRPDLVGEEMASILSSFQDRLPPFPQSIVKEILSHEFGPQAENFFAEFNFTSVASASIAQVHKAKLKDGTDVAVKILRPQIARIMNRDILTLRLLIKIISCFSKYLAKSFLDVARLLKQVSRDELDLLHEAANASRLKEDLQGLEGFYVPKIFWKDSTSKVLVLEWLNGIPFSNSKAIAESTFDKKQIARNFVISYFEQVYTHGFFHADMHPGNLFLLKNGDIGVVDFGIMGKIDKKTRIAIAEILIGFLQHDYKRVAEIHIEIGLVPPRTNVDELALSCRKIGETIVGSSVKDVSLAQLLTNLIIMTRDYKMVTRPDLLLLQKTLLLVEGVGITLDPNLNIWDLARPWVKKWAKKNIGFDAKIRDSILDLITLGRKFLREL